MVRTVDHWRQRAEPPNNAPVTATELERSTAAIANNLDVVELDEHGFEMLVAVDDSDSILVLQATDGMDPASPGVDRGSAAGIPLSRGLCVAYGRSPSGVRAAVAVGGAVPEHVAT